ncbi:hypothetical protein K435DRAFT_853407 [Dendrothele bispora CBS 962.96]|uniref:Cytosol aminopeptidase domain-containing protein n=1 Tax=Dendrothele bispora (strain CBS 962.96) TaxID=1314807 RepID=A0A4S8MHP3_DENBC|nr:hypothetical protein K435DRAFT_853407 [Dendrothele bispora CBS 962.96]
MDSRLFKVPAVEIVVRDTKWAEEKGIVSYLRLSLCLPYPILLVPVVCGYIDSDGYNPTRTLSQFLEIHYKGAPQKDAQPLVFVGKGITFDAGGISLKPRAGMKLIRGDMGGAASVISAALAFAKLQLPVSLAVRTPLMLMENIPGPSAAKPGDIVYAMNGKSVEVDNTDAEGRLVLSDTIYASTEYKPHTRIDVATLTGQTRNSAMDSALGEIYTGVFSSWDELWEQLHEAGDHEFDRFWRMPLNED